MVDTTFDTEADTEADTEPDTAVDMVFVDLHTDGFDVPFCWKQSCLFRSFYITPSNLFGLNSIDLVISLYLVTLISLSYHVLS